MPPKERNDKGKGRKDKGKGERQEPTGNPDRVLGKGATKNEGKLKQHQNRVLAPAALRKPVVRPTWNVAPPGKVTELLHNDWAVQLVIDAKRSYSFPAWWGAGALHHKISKTKLSSIGEQLTPSCNSRNAALRTAAFAFWNLCCGLAGEKLYEAVVQAGRSTAAHPTRLLWNLPIMYSLGPQSPATDPGENFDADTEPVPGGHGLRRIDAASAELKALEDIWDSASDADDGRGVYDARMWEKMCEHLARAAEILADKPDEAGHTGHTGHTGEAGETQRGERLLYPPMKEQWLHDTTTGQAIRKGLVYFPGIDLGTTLFRSARTVEDIGVHKGQVQVAATHTCTFGLGAAHIHLTLNVDENALHHICERHTLAFFSFTGRTRPINTMWLGVSTFDQAKLMALQYLPFIGEKCIQELLLTHHDDLYELDGFLFESGMVSAGPDTIYFKAEITKVKDTAIRLTVKTIAPDGTSALGFLRSELDRIAAALRIPPPAPDEAGSTAPTPQGRE